MINQVKFAMMLIVRCAMGERSFPHEEFVAVTGITQYRVVEKYLSKRNDVYRLACEENHNQEKKHIVVKYYSLSTLHLLPQEVKTLEFLYWQGVSVPNLYRAGSNLLVMEHIIGPTLLELIETAEHDSKHQQFNRYQVRKQLIFELLPWMEKAYAALDAVYGEPVILGEVHLRHFIAGKRLTGVDFKSCTAGRKEADLATLMAYILHYNPAWSLWKRQLTQELREAAIQLLRLDERILGQYLEEKISKLIHRRHHQQEQLFLG
ncbi:hypothetical protein SAMN06296020_101329 [Anoxynatronum buryatiense]|uniref:Uncharacterized protein n=2 Tax=Anoxynatronum buryatiense TaxID=489973 RepID=A0AA46AHJ4_9CLOT|nr:hypothetical protein SAMN06296020_101329 [Anoxynatronum buryatiense]